MGFKRFISKNVKANVDVKRWMDYSQVKQHGSLLKQTFQSFGQFKKKQLRNETFEQAVQRLQLTEADIQKKKKHSLWASIALLIIGILVFAYAFYFLFDGRILSGIVTFVIAVLMWAYAYQENFNYFQMKQRRLGCTFQEWLKGLFSRSK